MASTYSDLKIELIGTGEQTGTWGATTNTNFSVAFGEAITGSADVAFSSADQTITLTNTNAAQTARNLRLNLTGTSGGARQLTLGSGCQIEKLYLINNGLADAVTVLNASYSGVAVSTITFVTTTATATTSSNHGLTSGQTIVMTGCTPAAYNGTFIVTVTGLTTFTYTMLSNPGANASPVGSYTTPGTSVVVPAGKSMFVYNTGANVVDAVTHLSSLTLGTALPVASGGSGASTLTGVLKGNGTSAFTAATAGTDYVAPGTATTFTALQTFAGTTSNADLKTSNILETATVSATAAPASPPINYDITTQSVLYYTIAATGNFTVNFRGSSGTTLNDLMQNNESISVTFLVTNGSTAYYNSSVTIDGNSVTPKWQGGTAPTSGNINSTDSYTYVIIKTGSAAFTVLAAQTRFA